MEHEQELAKGVVLVVAHHLALKAVKAQLRRRGLHLYSFDQRELLTLAYQYRDEHPELITEAEETVRKVPQLRTLSERMQRQSKRKRS
jgi:hypothetical protein